MASTPPEPSATDATEEFERLRMAGNEEHGKTYEQRLQDIFDSNTPAEHDQEEQFIYDGRDIDLFEEEEDDDDDLHPSSKDYAARLDEILQLKKEQDLTSSPPSHLNKQPSTPLIIPPQPNHCSPTSSPSTSVSQRIRLNNSVTPSHSINGSAVSSNFWSNPRIRPPQANFSRLRSLRPSSSTANSISSLQLPHQRCLSSSTLASDRFAHSPNPSISHLPSHTTPSNLNNNNNGDQSNSTIIVIDEQQEPSRNQSIFRWISLRRISQKIYPSTSKKLINHTSNSRISSLHPTASNTLLGLPTVIAIGAVIVVGTARGWAIVFDYASNLKYILGSDVIVRDAGAVSALSISHDHTFVAVGHIMGHIYLYDLAKPNQPARSVTPTRLKLVQEGRSEGHLLGNRIIHIDFVGLRHTAIVSADETGLAFYHALGQVLGLASVDVIRILGKYPDLGISNPETNVPLTDSPHHTRQASEFSINSFTGLNQTQKSRKPTKIFGLLPLPLGPSAHATDEYGLVAILTSSKLIIIALKPTPRTCWRAMRNASDPNQTGSIGSLSWFPSAKVQETKEKKKPASPSEGLNGMGTEEPSMGMDPLLAFSWGKTIRFITTISDLPDHHTSTNPSLVNHDNHLVKDGFLKGFTKKFVPLDLSNLRFVEGKSWICQSNVLAIQWLSWRIICVLTSTHFEVIDTQIWQRTGFESIDIRTIVRLNVFNEIPSDSVLPTNATSSISDDQNVGGNLVGSFKAYKGKVFLLTTDDLRLGVVTSWADQILELVEVGSLTEAIELTTSYWIGRPDLETIGLPSQDSIRKSVVRPKLIEIMRASLEYVFSDRRMEDDTHFDQEGRGVDRTELFEGLVRSCIKACIEIDHLDFVLETMFEQYQEHGIQTIFLLQLEPFILRSQIHTLPTSITQELIGLHEERREFDLIDLIIRNVDPLCLDIHQVLAICSRELLYDSLVYVYTEAMNDFVGPIVEFLDLIKTIHSHRRRMLQYCEDSNIINGELVPFNSQKLDESIETLVPNAYKIFSYLSAIFCGLSYPNKIKYEAPRGSRARSEVYRFLFSGQSMHWPQPDGKLILTTEEGQQEPTYPYLRTLLAFDSEAMLDSLDIGFEDSWLHDHLDRDREKSIHRQLIINLLLEVIDADPEFLSPSDRTFVYIFIARNLPKYSQFLSLPSSTLHSILIGLSTDDDRSSTEDRQLAVEFLLSVYTPPDLENGTGELIEFFKDAGFWRILNSTYTQREMWVEVVDSFLKNPDLDSKIFDQLSETILNKVKSKKSEPSYEDLTVQILHVLLNWIHRLVEIDVTETGTLIEKFRPQSHLEVVESLPEEHTRFIYLQTLLEPSQIDQNDQLKREILTKTTDVAVPLSYITLLSKFNPTHVIQYLKSNQPILNLQTSEIVKICRENQIFDALVWQLDQAGTTRAAFEELDIILKTQASLITKLISGVDGSSEEENLEFDVNQLTRCALTAAEVCVERTSEGRDGLTGEDCWFYLLSSTIQCIQVCAPLLPTTGSSPPQAVAIHHPSELGSQSEDQQKDIDSAGAIDRLKGLLPTIVSLLISRTKFSNQISSSNLIRRLIESSSTNPGSSRSASNEFRSIILMIMETYKFEGNVLEVTGRLIDEDLFQHVEKLAKAKERGVRPNELVCFKCRQPIFTNDRRHQSSSWEEFKSSRDNQKKQQENEGEENEDDDDGDRVLDSPSRMELIKKLGLPPKSISPMRQRSIKGKEVEQTFDSSSTCFSPSTFNNHPASHYPRYNSSNTHNHHQLIELGGDSSLGDSFLNRGDTNPFFPPSPFLSGPPFRTSLTINNNPGPSPLSPTRKLDPFYKPDLIIDPSPLLLDPHQSVDLPLPASSSNPTGDRNLPSSLYLKSPLLPSSKNSRPQRHRPGFLNPIVSHSSDLIDHLHRQNPHHLSDPSFNLTNNQYNSHKNEFSFTLNHHQEQQQRERINNNSNSHNNNNHKGKMLNNNNRNTPAVVLLGHGKSFHFHCWFFHHPPNVHHSNRSPSSSSPPSSVSST